MNKKLSFLMESAMIEDCFNSVLVVFSVDRRWLRRNSAWEQGWVIWMSSFESAGMDFGVNLVFIWQFERVICF